VFRSPADRETEAAGLGNGGVLSGGGRSARRPRNRGHVRNSLGPGHALVWKVAAKPILQAPARSARFRPAMASAVPRDQFRTLALAGAPGENETETASGGARVAGGARVLLSRDGGSILPGA
jgi:hypothetical protein